MPKERLDKIIASQTSFSRKDARNLIKDGVVSVNGVLLEDCDRIIEPERDCVELFGKPFAIKKFIYIMLNKPAGVLSAAKDVRAKTVLDLIPESLYRRGIAPSGRLDKDTTGFLLITDDGEFSHKILSPKNHVFKTYEARLAKAIDTATLKGLESGIDLADGTRCLPAFTELVEDGDQPLVSIRIREGKYHQIKRMFAALGNQVNALKRVQIGGLALDPALPEGACRELTCEEVALICDG